MFFVFLFKGYGARLELHVRTHSVPTRSSADRPPRNALGRAAWLWPVPSALAALGRRLRNSLGRPAIGGLILTAPCRAQAITQPLRHALGLVAQGAHCLRDPGADVAQLLGQLAPLLTACPHGPLFIPALAGRALALHRHCRQRPLPQRPPASLAFPLRVPPIPPPPPL